MDRRSARLEIPGRFAVLLPRALLGATLVLALTVPLLLHFAFNRVAHVLVPAHDGDGFRSALEECRLGDGRLFVRGWAFIEGEDGVRKIDVYASSGDGNAVRIPSRVERREDVAESAGRPVEHDTLHDGFSAASSRLGRGLAPPVSVTLIRVDRDGRIRGGRHACR